jgi:hypothetical protein
MDDNNRNATATKGDVEDAMNRVRDEVLEAIRGIETKLLNTFYRYAKTTAA